MTTIAALAGSITFAAVAITFVAHAARIVLYATADDFGAGVDQPRNDARSHIGERLGGGRGVDQFHEGS